MSWARCKKKALSYPIALPTIFTRVRCLALVVNNILSDLLPLSRIMSAEVIQNAVKMSLKGMFIGDAVSMPVHWYYDVTAIARDFDGWISKYESPKDDHPTSILGISNKGGSGRSSGNDEPPPVIGRVILHDKAEAWKGKGASHYHQGMSAGQNTLNCHCALQVLKTLKSSQSDSESQVLKEILLNYVTFMTTPNSHNDTFAESWHRLFFADWVAADKPIEINSLSEFASKRSKRIFKQPSDKQLEVIGAFVLPLPLILHYIDRPLDDVIRLANNLLRLTHPVEILEEHFIRYITVLHAVVRGASLRVEAGKALEECLGPPAKHQMRAFDSKFEKSKDRLKTFQQLAEHLGIACYIEGAMALIYHICRQYHDDFEGGILINVNVGGENCHRGSALGALLGASVGASGRNIPEGWMMGLELNDEIERILQ